MALTELALKNLKPKDKRYLVRDDQGLYIEVNPTGRKYWKTMIQRSIRLDSHVVLTRLDQPRL